MAMASYNERTYPDLPSPRPHVIVVGAGVAGLTAAHRLLERGHDITLLEADSFVGGKLGTHEAWDEDQNSGADVLPTDGTGPFGARRCAVCTDPCCEAERLTDRHEHCYHMYLNWYYNFWQLMRDIGAIDRFEAQTEIFHQPPDPDAPPFSALNPGSPWTALHNLASGPSSVLDTCLYGQSMLDLLGTTERTDRRMDQISVEAFLLGLGYTTPESRKSSHRVLAKAFAAPTSMASASTFRSFIKYGARVPEPTMWLLNGDTVDAIFTPWLVKLADLAGRFEVVCEELHDRPGFKEALDHFASLNRTDEESESLPSLKIVPLHSLNGIEIDPKTGEFILRVEQTDRSPSVQPETPDTGNDISEPLWRFDGQVVLTIPPRQLAALVFSRARHRAADPDVCLVGIDPSLGNAARLKSAPIMVLDIVFREPPDRPLPRGIVNLLNSKFEMSLYDNTQMWTNAPGDAAGPHMISVCASDAATLMPFVDKEDGLAVIVDEMLREMQRYVRFDIEHDILHCRTHLQTNAGEELFINAVDTWNNRPKTTTGIPNLTIAGDFVQTPIDVVTIEAAAMSGLMAAEAVRRRTGQGREVPIKVPDTIPGALMAVAGTATRPLARVAHAISERETTLKAVYDRVFPKV